MIVRATSPGRGRVRAWRTWALALALAASATVSAAAEPVTVRGVTKVTYLAGASVYLEAGAAEGLAEGDTVYVVRAGARIAGLRIAVLSTRRASCDTLWTRAPIQVGDVVEFHGTLPAAPAASGDANVDSLRAAAIVTPSAGRAARRDSRWRGRLGVRWLGIDAPGSGRLSQPAFEARGDARDGLGGHLEASLDLRAHRTLRTSESGRWVEQYSRVYRASATLRDGSGARRLTLGRQSSPTLATVSVFDGGLAEWRGSRFGAGAFAGTQPEPLRSRWSSELLEMGGFVEAHQAPLTEDRWSLAAGAVDSRHRGEIDREFVFTQGWWSSAALSATLVQEVDLNRGWKRVAGEPAIAWTNTFASLRVPVGPRLALHSGYDNRRNVRLWRDRETPETEFDDRYRQGLWAGATVEPEAHTSFGGEYRAGAGGDRSHAGSVDGALQALGGWRPMVRARWASFANDALQSSLVSLAAGADPWSRSHAEFSLGERRTRDRLFDTEDRERWIGTDLDLSLGTRWYASASAERLNGPAGTSTQLQAGLSVRL